MIPAWERLKKHFTATTVLYVALFLYFLWPVLTLQEAFIRADYFDQHLPWARVFYDWVHGRADIFWTPMMGGGFPLAAEGQVGAFYPLHHVWYRILPFEAAYAWSTPLHLAIGGCGMYVYLRRCGLSRDASGLGAVLFSFGSGYGGSFFSPGGLRAIAWMPWCLAVLERVRFAPLKGRLGGWAVASVMITFMWTAGAAQSALYAILYLVLHEIICAVSQPFSGVTGSSRAPLGAGVLLRSFAVMVPVLIGTALAFPQLRLTWELTQVSVRSGESVAFALWGSAPPIFPLALVFPSWMILMRVSWYLGILALFLWLVPGRPAARSFAVRHWILAAVFGLLALG